MFLRKIKEKESGILLYGITPPKIQTAPEKVITIAEKTLERIYPLDIDALVVYDVQDESARTSEVRPFPFTGALDPFEFTTTHLQSLSIPKIIYRPAGKFTKEELAQWLQDLTDNKCYPVLVGLPAPDYKVKTSLKEAYEIWSKHKNDSVIGAVTIPERHATLGDEDIRMMDKMESGVSFFVSQCIFNIDYARETLEALAATCKYKKQEMPTVIFTLTVCGSVKTLEFMEWLGIHIPDSLKNELITTDNTVEQSVKIALDIADELINYCSEKSIPFGFNIESVAIRKEEIDASIFLVNKIGEMLKAKGLRKKSGEIAEQSRA
ncbi:methylenetetrahydrofolate reductase [Ferruginibacter lapsinanis]|uniref:methylenetetrahydrofolate reductase n=1 Tax=Ferruginibacter lapsinanis TaxID=563172 RepID=UPI001E4B29C2|nr:methylenetetrahydrofolate reductase [Ferruginibacter lapsinanis]UEG49197.1 methylenetetrahydrofolate reductase [Ferruginibacter lapsinanis]